MSVWIKAQGDITTLNNNGQFEMSLWRVGWTVKTLVQAECGQYG